MKHIKLFLLLFLIVQLSYAQKDTTKHGTGLQYDDEAYQQTPMKAPLVRSLYGSSLPASASIKKYAPQIKNQGSYGTCVGWSAAYCARTIIEAQKNGWTDKATITDNAFSPGFTYKLIKMASDANCSYGASINKAMLTFMNQGAVKYNSLKISCPATLSSELYTEASQYKINDYAKLFGLNDGKNFKIQATKKSLSQNKPVVIGMKCPPSFYDATDIWTPKENPGGNFGGHAMCLVGYDDNKYGGAFHIQNSWGNYWGNQGYTWIKYDDYADFTKYAYEIIENFKQPETELSLSGSVRYVLRQGDEMQATQKGNIYKVKRAYKSGTLFRLYISNNEPAFVYAFGSDATKKVFPIFPHQQGISPALNYKQNDVAIPDEEHYIEMDNTVGTDYLCVLYSAKALDIEDIQRKVENGYGSFDQKVKNAVGDQMLDFSDVEYFSGNKIGFKATTTDKSVVALIVEIKHVK